MAPAGTERGACRKSRAQVCDSSMSCSSPALSQGLRFLICRVGIASDHSSGLVPGAWANGVGWGPGLKSWACHCLPSCQVSDLRNQVYPETGLDPFPGEGRVVGRQRIRKLSVAVEYPGELGPEAEPGGWGCCIEQAPDVLLHYHSQTLSGPRLQCPPCRFQDDPREVPEPSPQVCDP